MDLHLRDLRYFEIAADAGHLGRAADQLARSQPALSKCIQRLEDAFGSPLFERAGRGIRLTPVGEVLLARARSLRGAAEDAMREVSDFARGHAGHVRIGSGPIAADHLLPELCRLALADGADTTIGIVTGSSPELRHDLREGKLDLLIGLTADGDPDLLSHAIAKDVVVVAASPTHPVFAQRRITMESLLAYRWALPVPAVASRQWIDTAFASAGLARPTVQIEANTIPLLPRMVARTELLSFVSRHTLALQRDTDVLKEVKLAPTTLRRSLGVTHRRLGYLSPAATRILGLLRTHGPALFGRGMARAADDA